MASSVASAGFVTSVPLHSLRSLRCVRCVGWKSRFSDCLAITSRHSCSPVQRLL